MELGATLAGTAIKLALAPVASLASAGVGKDGYPFDVLATLGRVDTGDHFRPVVTVAEPVETGLATGQAMDDDFGGLIDKYAHFPSPASSTARRAALDHVRRTDHTAGLDCPQYFPALLGIGPV